MCFGISRPSFYECIEQVSDAVVPHFPLPGAGNSREECTCAAVSLKRSRFLMNPISGCIGAVDGIVIQTKPRQVPEPVQYLNRKGYCAFPVQAVVDGSYRLYASMKCVESAQDSLAW